MNTNEALIEFFRKVQYREIPGSRSNPALLAMIRRWIPWATDDSTTAWCAILRAEAAKATKTAIPAKPFRALSWLTAGADVALQDARQGDTAILDRGGGKGHVGLYMGHANNRVTTYGGNQRNRITEDSFPLDDLLGIRRFS